MIVSKYDAFHFDVLTGWLLIKSPMVIPTQAIEKDVLERKSLGDVKVSVERIERGTRVKKYVAHYRQRTRHLLKLHSRLQMLSSTVPSNLHCKGRHGE